MSNSDITFMCSDLKYLVSITTLPLFSNQKYGVIKSYTFCMTDSGAPFKYPQHIIGKRRKIQSIEINMH